MSLDMLIVRRSMLERIDHKFDISFWMVHAVLLGLCGYFFYQLVLMIFDPSLFHEEESSLFRYHSDEYFGQDLIYQYLNSSVLPPLYELSIRAFAYFNSNIQRYFDFYVLVCLLLTLVPVALIGVFVSGITTGLILVLYILIQPVYSYQIVSATPHSLAFPILFWCTYFLMRKSYVCLSVLSVTASIVYLPMAVTVGLCLAGMVVVYVFKNYGKSQGSLVKKCLLVGIAGLGSLVLVKYQLQPLSGFGVPLGTFENAELYPENGVDGRHHSSVTEPALYVITQTLNQFKDTLSASLEIFLFSVYVVVSVIVLVINRNMKGWSGLVNFSLIGVGIYAIIAYYKPEFCYRYVIYPLFTALPILYVCGIVNKIAVGGGAVISLRNGIGAISLLIIPLLAFDSLNRDKVGFINKVDRYKGSLMYFVENSIPADALIAAWPYEMETEYIPYIAAKSTLVLGKAHYPTHVSYIMEMRKRTLALADAYLGNDFMGLKHLKCEFGVDYFIVDLRIFEDLIENLAYFEPFNQYVKDQIQLKQGAPFSMLDIPDSWLAFSDDNYRAIEMNRVVRENPC